MLKNFLILSTAITLCVANFVPVSKYTGQHSFDCGYGLTITGARVNDKLYTFGGCYSIPHTIQPDEDGHGDMLNRVSGFMGTIDSVNVTDNVQAYDFATDVWLNEETFKTPIPWRKASLQVVNNTIYAYSLISRPASSHVALWKYDMGIKEWSELPEIPFIWQSTLRSCEKEGKIYFTGSEDGQFHNIIQIYNTKTETWEKPFYLKKKLHDTKAIICGKDEIHFFAKEAKLADVDNVTWDSLIFGKVKKSTYTIFSFEYDTGKTNEEGHHNVTGNFDNANIATQDEWFYLLDVEKAGSTIFKLNAKTSEQVILETIPYTLHNPLLIPYNEEVFFFGGGEDTNFGMEIPGAHVNAIKVYNHKITNNQEEDTSSNEDSVKFILQEE